MTNLGPLISVDLLWAELGGYNLVWLMLDITYYALDYVLDDFVLQI